jgi:hypothetical protein
MHIERSLLTSFVKYHLAWFGARTRFFHQLFIILRLLSTTEEIDGVQEKYWESVISLSYSTQFYMCHMQQEEQQVKVCCQASIVSHYLVV